jgi:hypothetical protein
MKVEVTKKKKRTKEGRIKRKQKSVIKIKIKKSA